MFRYFHIYWIPIFPTSRKVLTQCPHCKHSEVAAKKGAGDRFGPIADLKPDPYPARVYSGVALFFLLGALGWYQDSQTKQATMAYLASPAANDLYVMKLDNPVRQGAKSLDYSVLKFEKKDEQGFHFHPSKYAYLSFSNAVSDVTRGAGAAATSFEAEEVLYPLEKIEALQKRGFIAGILRLGQ